MDSTLTVHYSLTIKGGEQYGPTKKEDRPTRINRLFTKN